MVAFSERPLCYQVGMLLLLMATAVFAAGVALPWWAQTRGRDSDIITSHSGLWLGCSSATGEEQCSTIDAPNWFKTVQALQGLSLAGMLVACAYAIFTNCCLDHATFSRTMEIASGAGGVLGVVSSVLYVAKTSHIIRLSPDASYSWAFAMDVAACVFVTFLAAIIALTNSRHPDDTATHFLVEDGGSHHYGHPHRSGLRGKQREWEIEMTPMRVSKPPPTSGSRAEVIVMQNNYCAEPQLKTVRTPGAKAAASAAFSGPVHACHPTWQSNPVQAQVSSSGHGHFCKTPYTSSPKCLPDCHSDGQKTPCSCTKLSEGPLPRPHCNTSYDQNHLSNCLPLPPVASCQCCGSNPSQSLHESQYYQQDTSPPKAERDIVSYPRVEATAPPLSLQSEDGEPVTFSTTHYFGNTDTVCVDEDVESG